MTLKASPGGSTAEKGTEREDSGGQTRQALRLRFLSKFQGLSLRVWGRRVLWCDLHS